MPTPDATSRRTKIRAHPERARYDAATIRAILDAGLVCHVAFVDEGVPVVVPPDANPCTVLEAPPHVTAWPLRTDR